MRSIATILLIILVSTLRSQTLYLSITDVDNRALRNPVVNINDSNYTADIMGKLEINIPVGEYCIFASAYGCIPYSGYVKIEGDTYYAIKMQLKWIVFTIETTSNSVCKVKVGNVTTTTSGGKAKITVREGLSYDIYVIPEVTPFQTKVLAKRDTTIIVNIP